MPGATAVLHVCQACTLFRPHERACELVQDGVSVKTLHSLTAWLALRNIWRTKLAATM